MGKLTDDFYITSADSYRDRDISLGVFLYLLDLA